MLNRIPRQPSFQIKADRDGFVLLVPAHVSLEHLLAELRKKVIESRGFFQKARMILDLRERDFHVDEVQVIRTLLEDVGGIQLHEIRLGKNLQSFLMWASGLLGIPIKIMEGHGGNAERFREKGVKVREETDAGDAPLVVRQTCRSGTRIESPAELIILGDVNPGAEILAARDIIVFGTLRGIAHAGIYGDRSAKIWGLHIEPQQLRIADVVAVPPRERTMKPKRYEVAEIQGDRIQVTRF
ncbi:septum site-determining protein MinC [Desulfosoma caldarium]|uniref:Probable septum site-determining protein MinC n=1 Tax=Desulfosoma caldarium TaxID=610254 RepID=A0A3N1VR35_9BACT|nr:septum site-determining protein MinC [Desulfosoma caldarium]ROR03518.1 septum site-determining protein MinC [Desulfosoma caldarium]